MIKQLDVDQIKEAAIESVNTATQEKQKSLPSTSPLTAAIIQGVGYNCFYEYANTIIVGFNNRDRAGSASVIEQTIASLKKFTKKQRLPFTAITQEFLESYEVWYLSQFNSKGKNNTINGLGFRMREIRRLFNLAIKDKTTKVDERHYPFGRYGYSIKKEKTVNRDIEASEIAKLYQLELSPETRLWHHQNFFKYYFECWGMNFADIAHLKVYQVQNGRLIYRRRKTRWASSAKKFDIPHSSIAQEIIDYYVHNKNSNDYVFPILDDLDGSEDHELIFKKLGDRRNNHIRRLKTIAKKAGVKDNVTTYVGRHSFFSIALKNGVSKSSISELAGHSNFQITETYLSGFKDNQLSDNAGVVQSLIESQLKNHHQKDTSEELITIKSTGEMVHPLIFLKGLVKKNGLDVSNTTPLLIALISKTDCEDGRVAQNYIDEFMATQPKKSA